MKTRILSYLITFLLIVVSAYSQNQSGLLIGGGIGFEHTTPNLKNTDYLKGMRFSDSYKYNVELGYRFRFAQFACERLFIDVDPLLRLQTFKSKSFSPGTGSDYNSGPVIAEANNANFQLALSPSVNFRLIDGFYVGAGFEPTWNIVTDGKHFDIPVFGRLGYDFGRVGLAVTYRQGFLNVINDRTFDKGRTSSLNFSLFVPFHIGK